MNASTKSIGVVIIFSIAMAALESAVVVYLRALYYPDGFTVALRVMDEKILLIEIMREAATLTMLLTVGYLAGKNLKERMAYFLFSFAVWDIFYYGWLKVFIGWPASVLEWDILFLIPVTWLGPVLAPLICSATMLLLAVVLLFNAKPVSSLGSGLLLLGSAFILYTFMEDYGWLMFSNGFISDYARIMQNADFIRLASTYVPTQFNWRIFWVGEVLLLSGIFCQYKGIAGFRNSTRYSDAPL